MVSVAENHMHISGLTGPKLDERVLKKVNEVVELKKSIPGSES